MSTTVDRDVVVLASDIRVLSTLLSAIDFEWPDTGFHSNQNQNSAFSHISTLLFIGTDIAVATTGSITAENVSTIILYPRMEESQHSERIETRAIVPSNRSPGEILQNHHTSLDLEGYVSDLLTLFKANDAGELPVHSIIEWVIHRGWTKLFERLLRSKLDFAGDLFDIMENWLPDDDDDIPDKAILLVTISEVYSKYGVSLHQVDGQNTFALNKGSAPTLIKTIAQIFRDMRQTMSDPTVDREAAASSLVDPFIFLWIVLTNKHVKAFMTESSFRYRILPRRLQDIARNERSNTTGWDPLTEKDFQHDSHYALRYMQMLVSCVTSAVNLARKHLPQVISANTTMVSVSTPAYDAELERSRVMQILINLIKDRDPGPEWEDGAVEWLCELEAKASQEGPCRAHAEAGLMALACKARLSHEGGHENESYSSAFVGAAPVPIGINGRCCPLCFRMGQLLNSHAFAMGMGLAFLLPDTHGKVLPWDPPQFGIPKSILAQMRDELQTKVIDAAIVAGRRRVRLASPRSDEDYLYRLYYPMLANTAT